MADYTIDGDQQGVYEQTTVAGDADSVEFTDQDSYRAADVKLFTDGAGPIYYRTDGVDPVVEDQECRYIPAFPGEADIHIPEGQNTVALISAAAVTYSVYKE